MSTSSPFEARHVPQAAALLVAAVYAVQGHRVSWPLEPARYDLLVEPPDGGTIVRVQVKSCSTKQNGNWICWVTRSRYAAVPGGKRRVPYEGGEVDVLAVVTADLEVYVLPFAVVAGRTAVPLSALGEYCVAELLPATRVSAARDHPV